WPHLLRRNAGERHRRDVGGRAAVADRRISEGSDQHADGERRDEDRVQATLYTMEYSAQRFLRSSASKRRRSTAIAAEAFFSIARKRATRRWPNGVTRAPPPREPPMAVAITGSRKS